MFVRDARKKVLSCQRCQQGDVEGCRYIQRGGGGGRRREEM